MKILALDIGDVWTGTAISDPLGIIAKPYKTVTTKALIGALNTINVQEKDSLIVIWWPKTMRGTISEQTKKTEEVAEHLKYAYPNVQWILWDERLSSKRADSLKKLKSKEEKIASHSIAAAFILSSYLESLRLFS